MVLSNIRAYRGSEEGVLKGLNFLMVLGQRGWQGCKEDDIASFRGAVRAGLRKLGTDIYIYTCPDLPLFVIYLVYYSCWKQKANIGFENTTCMR